jgi:hypothetical protein
MVVGGNLGGGVGARADEKSTSSNWNGTNGGKCSSLIPRDSLEDQRLPSHGGYTYVGMQSCQVLFKQLVAGYFGDRANGTSMRQCGRRDK